MKPGVLNRICAHPIILAWVLGAVVTNATTIIALSGSFFLSTVLTDVQIMLQLLVGFTSTTLLGYFLGMFTCWPWIRVMCSRYNGGPLQIGDQVQILIGPHRSSLVSVYELTQGQGGWNLVRLVLGEDSQINFTDIFEEYSVLRISSLADAG